MSAASTGKGAIGAMLGSVLLAGLAACAGAQGTGQVKSAEPTAGSATPSASTPSAAGTGSARPSGPSGGGGAGGPTASPSPHLHLVAIGDSLAQPSSCDGCTDFVELYGEAVAGALRRPVDVDNRTAIEFSALPAVQSSQLLDDILTDQSLRTAIADADIVVVNVGFNDTPWGRIDNPCGASNLAATIVDWSKITTACITRVTDEYAQTLNEIVTQIDELRGCFLPPGLPPTFCQTADRNTTMLRLTTTYDDWIGEAGTPAAAQAPTEAADRAFVAAACWVVTAQGGQCADIYHVLNGSKGTADAARFLVADHTHFNQQVHQAIADALVKLGFDPLMSIDKAP
jgi:lysophospholipase L1-like esterase